MIFCLLKKGFEEVEALTVVDYLRRADIEITTVGVDEEYVEGAHNITVKTDIVYDEIPELGATDGVYIPGGGAVSALSEDEKVLELLRKADREGKMIFSICAGPYVLAKAGILEGKTVTCFPGFEDKIEALGYKTDVSKLVIVDQNITTSRSAATAVLFSLKLIELIKGKQKSEEIKKSILQDLVEESFCA